ncbi:MAG: bacteriohemerythrin [Negativicutes bacterium]
MYQWKDEYVLGIDEIDVQHRRLIEIANEVNTVLNDQWRLDKYNQILKVLDELKAYTVYHFQSEEAYMVRIGYKKRFSHAMQHKAFVEKLKAVDLSEVDEAQEKYLRELLSFITDWVVNHIMTTDRLYVCKP